ncbi:hypothetical protein [Paractinoplanes rishiriensis]|uniref:Uncharacterized protein n=1 Tax=Paractinoplanes rishiriensis TaxID=1050105 RepID=A0A919K0K2_9ACTN|nr:hypothetical protein [Actinoplanes rishiriensis]GIE97184.1 hypothetical protein Ari01nite_46490 [Actinoplanes rishiriensis]
MADRQSPGSYLRSLLTLDRLLRLAAVVLSGLILVRVLFAGTAGWWSILLVAGTAALVLGVVKLAERMRTLLPGDQTGTADSLSNSRFAAFVATRSRPAAVLALLVLVIHAAITGYIGIWTILITVVLAAIATLLSPNLRLVALLGGTAIVFAAATVFVADAFQGSAEARALAVSVAGIILPVLVSDKLTTLVKLPPLTTAHHAVLAVLTLVLGFLGWTRADWLPGVSNDCYTLPTSTGITTLRATADGDRCYGLLDTADPGVFAAGAFGKDPVTIALQRRILAANRGLEDGDLTVVWLGALSCEPLPADRTRCADGRDYPSERDQLRALLYAQAHIAATKSHRMHVVIADATQDVERIDDIAKMIIDRRPALGSRLVVIGGGDSRDTTQQAINRLLDAGIPFIAPNLLADLGAPGRPFVDRPGYLQLAPSNLAYAQDAVDRLRLRFDKGFRLDIYQHPSPTDHYTTSLVNDLLAAVRAAPGGTARHVAGPDRIDDGICPANPDPKPTVLYFADRWTRFAEFVQRVNEVCGHARPRLVIADVSVSRFMANYQLRAATNADWPVDYNVGGPSCADLTPAGFAALSKQIHDFRDLVRLRPGATFTCADRLPAAAGGRLTNACPLDAAVKLTSQPCPANDLGTYLIPAWDAALLADALLPAAPPAGKDYLTALELPRFTLSTGKTARVIGGRLEKPTIDVRVWHVDPLNNPATVWERPSADLRGADLDSSGDLPRLAE